MSEIQIFFVIDLKGGGCMIKRNLLDYLDAPTIIALIKIYNLKYSHLAYRLGFSKQNLVYLLKHDRFKEYQRMQIYQFFKEYQMEDLELILINHMTKKQGGKTQNAAYQ